MPRSKTSEAKKRESTPSGSDSDSGPEDRNPPSKKTKISGGRVDDEEGNASWSLENKRFVKVREFKGKVMVDIREYYDAGGDLKPGKKGISLSTAQWKKFLSYVDEIDDAIKEKC